MTEELDIESVKNSLLERDLFSEEEVNKIKQMVKEASINRIVFAQLFLSSYDTLNNNLDVLEEEDRKILQTILNKLKVSSDTFRLYLESYGN